MKRNGFWSWSSALCLSAMTLTAQETNEVELLRRQLREATESFDKVVQQQRQVIESLTKKVEALDQKNPAKPLPPGPPPVASTATPAGAAAITVPVPTASAA